ncbi:MAG TPA: anaerobic ribonucleoside-triphosphate reductase activating protein [Methanospirillum sp.]|nr:anaerobic ribonucleoside-triphosphate reductase activating protein [Methanospirillum sp.]
MADSILINFGGFVPLSTVDWRGRSVCVVFFRGCPLRCWYCQNTNIQSGTDLQDCDGILKMIRGAGLLISGVVFSGGEATMQPEALIYLARKAREMGLATGLHTNGVYPQTIAALIKEQIIDLIALDMKPEWNLNTVRGKERALVTEVTQSLDICTQAFGDGTLPGIEVVLTLFPNSSEQIEAIIPQVPPDVDVVLVQGELIGVRPLPREELVKIGDRFGRPVRIRTREEGETWYEGNRNSRDAGIRER